MEFGSKTIDRRTFLKILGSAGITLAGTSLSGCTEEYIKEQKSPDGRISRLVLPQGENEIGRGRYSLYLPASYFVKQPVTMDAMVKGYAFKIGLTVELLDQSNVRLMGSLDINSPSQQHEEWSIRGPLGGLQKPHTYAVEWENSQVRRLIWDDNIIPSPAKTLPSSI